MHEFLFGINFAKVVLYIVNLTHQVQLSPNKMQDMFVCGIFSIRNVLLFLWTFLFVRKILRGYESVIWKCNCCCIQKFLGSSFQQICHELNGLQSPSEAQLWQPLTKFWRLIASSCCVFTIADLVVLVLIPPKPFHSICVLRIPVNLEINILQ